MAKARKAVVPMTKHQKALEWAIKEIGVRESPMGSNTGPVVKTYQALGTWLPGTGFPWCAGFANLAVIRGGYTGLARTAGAWDALARAAKQGFATTDWKLVRPGDLVVFNVGSGHIAVVEKIVDGFVRSVDGNSSDQVKRCERPLSLVRGFICWPEDGVEKASARKPLAQVVGGESGRRKLVVGKLKVRIPDKVT